MAEIHGRIQLQFSDLSQSRETCAQVSFFKLKPRKISDGDGHFSVENVFL